MGARNYVYGFRIAATLRSDALWYEANALSARHTVFLGLLMIALELTLPLAMRNVTLRAVAIIGLATIIVADWRAGQSLGPRTGCWQIDCPTPRAAVGRS